MEIDLFSHSRLCTKKISHQTPPMTLVSLPVHNQVSPLYIVKSITQQQPLGGNCSNSLNLTSCSWKNLCKSVPVLSMNGSSVSFSFFFFPFPPPQLPLASNLLCHHAGPELSIYSCLGCKKVGNDRVLLLSIFKGSQLWKTHWLIIQSIPNRQYLRLKENGKSRKKRVGSWWMISCCYTVFIAETYRKAKERQLLKRTFSPFCPHQNQQPPNRRTALLREVAAEAVC